MSKASESWDPTAAPPEEQAPSGFFAELWTFIWQNKIWWMAPTLIILAGLVTIILMVSDQAVAPFFYALF